MTRPGAPWGRRQSRRRALCADDRVSPRLAALRACTLVAVLAATLLAASASATAHRPSTGDDPAPATADGTLSEADVQATDGMVRATPEMRFRAQHTGSRSDATGAGLALRELHEHPHAQRLADVLVARWEAARDGSNSSEGKRLVLERSGLDIIAATAAVRRYRAGAARRGADADAAAPTQAGTIDASSHKLVLLIRHAEAEHNRLKALRDPGYHKVPDPSLTEVGRSQAAALRRSLSEAQRFAHIEIDAVLTSPLARAVETVAGALLQHDADDHTGTTARHSDQQAADADARAGGSAPATVSHVDAHCVAPTHVELQPLFAEHDFGGAPCDTGSPGADLERRFNEPNAWMPALASLDASMRSGFGTLGDDWMPRRESRADFDARVRGAARLLSARPEGCLAVVTHGHFLRHLLGPRFAADVGNADVVPVLWPNEGEPETASDATSSASGGDDGAASVPAKMPRQLETSDSIVSEPTDKDQTVQELLVDDAVYRAMGAADRINAEQEGAALVEALRDAAATSACKGRLGVKRWARLQRMWAGVTAAVDRQRATAAARDASTATAGARVLGVAVSGVVSELDATHLRATRILSRLREAQALTLPAGNSGGGSAAAPGDTACFGLATLVSHLSDRLAEDNRDDGADGSGGGYL